MAMPLVGVADPSGGGVARPSTGLRSLPGPRCGVSVVIAPFA